MQKLVLFIGLLTIFLHAAGQQKDTVSSFEGYIEYKTEFKSLMAGVSDNEIRDRVGEFLRIYFKEGNLKWVFTDDAGYVRSTQVTIRATNTSYDWSDRYPDTLFSFDLGSTKRIQIDKMEEAGSDTVLGCICKVAKLTGSISYENPPVSVPSVYYYSFCPSLRVNPDHYKKAKETRWDEVTAKYRSIAIRIVSHFEGSVSGIFTAINIKAGPVDPSEFAIDRSKIIKPTFVD